MGEKIQSNNWIKQKPRRHIYTIVKQTNMLKEYMQEERRSSALGGNYTNGAKRSNEHGFGKTCPTKSPNQYIYIFTYSSPICREQLIVYNSTAPFILYIVMKQQQIRPYLCLT